MFSVSIVNNFFLSCRTNNYNYIQVALLSSGRWYKADVQICGCGKEKKTNVDAENIRLLPIVLCHASGPISGV